jgi:hypothetical protein
MAKYVLVVAPSQPDLYVDLAHEFRDDAVVDVILDRRVGERRSATALVPGGQRDRRRCERRVNPYSHRGMAALGFLLVRVTST